MNKLNESQRNFIIFGKITPLNESINKLTTVEEPEITNVISKYLKGNETFEVIQDQLYNHIFMGVNTQLEKDLSKLGLAIESTPSNYKSKSPIVIIGTIEDQQIIIDLNMRGVEFFGKIDFIDEEVKETNFSNISGTDYKSLWKDIKTEITYIINSNKNAK